MPLLSRKSLKTGLRKLMKALKPRTPNGPSKKYSTILKLLSSKKPKILLSVDSPSISQKPKVREQLKSQLRFPATSTKLENNTSILKEYNPSSEFFLRFPLAERSKLNLKPSKRSLISVIISLIELPNLETLKRKIGSSTSMNKIKSNRS